MSEAAMGNNLPSQIYFIQNNISQNTGGAQNQSASTMEANAKELFSQYGVNNVLQAVTNAAAEYLKNALNELVENMDMPAFMKEDAKVAIDQAMNGKNSMVPASLQQDTNQAIKGGSEQSGDDIMSGIMKMVQEAMREETESASSSGSGGRASKGGGNWLAVLARALGSTAGEHLKKMVELGEKMGGLDSKENPEEFAQIQADFQAEAQIFKMFQEAIGTMIKSIGEGMSSVARKQ
jgi:hypothetical protein